VVDVISLAGIHLLYSSSHNILFQKLHAAHAAAAVLLWILAPVVDLASFNSPSAAAAAPAASLPGLKLLLQ
jgi:hypothetical protein